MNLTKLGFGLALVVIVLFTSELSVAAPSTQSPAETVRAILSDPDNVFLRYTNPTAVLRDAGGDAKKYGGKAKDYAKVSVTTLTKNGERVSVHAVQNVKTGKTYEYKFVVGR